MKYWYDTEFIEDGKTIELISLGIISEDDREFYLQSAEYDPANASDWVAHNVYPNLSQCPGFPTYTKIDHQNSIIPLNDGAHSICPGYQPDCPWASRGTIREKLLEFLGVTPSWDGISDTNIELYGYYSAYDHVALCQLFGTMMDLPLGMPMYTRDIKQIADMINVTELPAQKGAAHNALEDALWTRDTYLWLYEKWSAGI